MWLIVYSNDHAPLTIRPIYSSSKLRTAQMMIFSLVAMIGLEKCCITSAYVCSGYVTQVSEPWPMGLLFMHCGSEPTVQFTVCFCSFQFSSFVHLRQCQCFFFDFHFKWQKLSKLAEIIRNIILFLIFSSPVWKNRRSYCTTPCFGGSSVNKNVKVLCQSL